MISACGQTPESAESPISEEGLVRTTLDNGLKVILLEDHSAPVVALNVWVRVGSADEREDEAGMAHVFEHMLFKGTEKRAVGEIAATVEAAGGNINAFTSYDMTVYHITMASRDAAIGIDVLSDAVQHSTFDPVELSREEEVVLEEINRSLDSPGRALSRGVFETAYASHPYRLPVLGTVESVKSFTREGLLDFFARWYVPNNMTFIAVGDFDSDAVLVQIRESFRDARPRPDLDHPRQPESVQASPRALVLRTEFEQSLIGLAYPITAFAEPDTPYLDLLSMVLGGGESSRLYRNVKDREQLVHSIGSSSYTPLDPGLFMIDAALDAERIEEAVAAISTEVQRIRDFGPSQSELERARVILLSSEVHEKETVQGQTRKLGYFETLGGGIEHEDAYLEAIRGATRDDLRRVAVEYLAPSRASFVASLEKDQGAELDETKLVDAFLGSTDEVAASLEGVELRDGVWRYTLGNGLRVIVKPNGAVPLVSLRMSFLGGLLAESESTQGVTSFLADMLDRGTEQRSAAQVAAETEDIAGSLSGFSGRNSFGVAGEFLLDTLDKGLELFADVVLHPAFDESEVEKLRVERLAALQRREDNLTAKAYEIFLRDMFRGHPYRFPTIGIAETIEKFDKESLLAYYGTYAHPSNAVLSVVGDVEPNQIVETLSLQFGAWTGPARVTLPERASPSPPHGPRKVSLEKNKSQVHIIVGFPGLSVSDPDLPALEVLTQILSGQGGRLFRELRDRQSLAYGVYAFSIEGLDPGSFGAYIASAPDKLDQSLDGLRSELGKIAAGPISDEEFDRARNYLIGTQAVSLQRYGTQAALLSLDELYGLGATHHLDYASRIQAVTLDDLARVAQRIIQLDTGVVAIVR
jgi:zinc protease